MQITVNINDEWVEGQLLDEALAEVIKQTVLREMLAKYDSVITAQIRSGVERLIQDTFPRHIDGMFDDIMNSGTVSLGKDSVVQIREHLSGRLMQSLNNSYGTSTLEKLAKTCSEQLKKRYDLTFATMIVENMKQHGLLKDDVALMLTNMNQQAQP